MPNLDPTAIRERVADERKSLADWETGEAWNWDGSMRCGLCGREPCCCGVPHLFRDAYDALVTRFGEALSTIEALLDERDERAFREQDERARFMEGPPCPTE